MYFNDNSLEEELLEYTELNGLWIAWIDELKMIKRTKRGA